MFTTSTPMTSDVRLVTKVSKYLNRTDSTNVGSAARRVVTRAKVNKAVHGLVRIRLSTEYLVKKRARKALLKVHLRQLVVVIVLTLYLQVGL